MYVLVDTMIVLVQNIPSLPSCFLYIVLRSRNGLESRTDDTIKGERTSGTTWPNDGWDSTRDLLRMRPRGSRRKIPRPPLPGLQPSAVPRGPTGPQPNLAVPPLFGNDYIPDSARAFDYILLLYLHASYLSRWCISFGRAWCAGMTCSPQRLHHSFVFSVLKKIGTSKPGWLNAIHPADFDAITWM